MLIWILIYSHLDCLITSILVHFESALVPVNELSLVLDSTEFNDASYKNLSQHKAFVRETTPYRLVCYQVVTRCCLQR